MRFLGLVFATLAPSVAYANVVSIAPQKIIDAVGVPKGDGFAGYLSAMYGAGVAGVAVIAVVMIVWGAIQVFGESVWGKTQGKAKIWNAVWGLLLAAGSFVILRTVSESLVQADFALSESLGAETQGVAISDPTLGDINRPNRYSWADPFDSTGSGPKQTGAWSEVNTYSELSAWQKEYMRNMGYDGLLASGGTLNADGTYTLNSRVTGYWDGDPDTNAGRGAFGPLRHYSDGSYGTAAVDPSVIPYGSIIAVNRNGSTQYYVAEDIGGAVVNRQASGGTAPVIDIATRSSWDGGYQTVTVHPYTGTTPYTSLTQTQRTNYLNQSGIGN
jgi:3D (Asp-Asp-Asp) domain-containing protein/TM2 domain-containing membrane protein YozV